MSLRHHSIASGGATLPAVESGPEDGIPVVFLHAGVADHRMWQRQVETVAAGGYRGIAFTRRGFGESASPDEAFSHLGDLETVLDHFGIHAAIFAGCSMGGGIALDFALAHPGRTVGLVLVATAITGGAYDLSDSDEQMSGLLEDAEERGDTEMLNRMEAHAWLDGPRAPAGRVAGPVRELFLDMNARALAFSPRLTGETRPPSAAGRLAQANAPTLLVAGDLDFHYILTRHEQLADDLPNAFATIIEGTAHLPSLERPDLFEPLLLEFLATVTE